MSTQIVNADSEFKNNLLKLDVSKTAQDKVKVSLYTNKSYNDSVLVNKKSDTEYIILMPETANSMTAKPISGTASDVIKNIEIKTQQYQNNIKGYTKILITTTKPIEITSNIHVLPPSQVQLSEKEYSELLAQIVKNKSNNLNKETNNLKTAKARSASTAEIKTAKAEKASSQTALPPRKKAEINTEKSETYQPKTEEKTDLKKAVSQTQETQEQTEKPAQTTKVAEKQVATTDTLTPSAEVEQKNFEAPLTQVKEGKQNKWDKLKSIIVSEIYYAIGIIGAIFIILLLIAKKMTRNLHKQKEFFTENLEEKPVSITDFTDKISDDMTWKEKYQTYLDATQTEDNTTETPPAQDLNVENDINDLFGKTLSYQAEKASGGQIEQNNIKESFSTVQPSSSAADDDSELVNSLFAEEDTDFANEQTDYMYTTGVKETGLFIKEEVVEEKSTEDELIKSEYAIDDEKLLYLVDFEDSTALVGRIEDEIFVLKKFEEKINAPIKARLNEKKGNSTNYMTKIGSYKAIVEVTPKKMNLLIEL